MRKSVIGFLGGSALLACWALLPSPAAADLIVDPQLFVQNSGTAPAGGDPNLITAPGTTGFVVGVAGSDTMEDPLLLIIGVYDGTSSSTAPTIAVTGATVTQPAPLGTYGSTATKATFTNSSIGDAFDQFGLSAGGSESFGNWACGKNGCPGTGGDIGLGLAMPTSFELFSYEISGEELTAGTPFSVTETGAPKGSYIIAYGCKDDTGTTTAACDKPGDIGQTVYTDTGLVDAGGGGGGGGGGTVPEPSTVVVFAVGLLGLGYMMRRRRSA